MKEKVVVCDVDGCLLDIFKLYKEIAKILGKRIPFFETEQIARDLQAILTVINEVLSE